jgi:hypothetical protein
MTTYKTLTWREIEKLDTPGFYRLPFYNDDQNVEVVYATPNTDDVRMKVIIVKIDENTYQDFYYNGEEQVFKPLTVNYYEHEDPDDNINNYSFGEEWKNSAVGIDCPKEFAYLIGLTEDEAWGF